MRECAGRWMIGWLSQDCLVLLLRPLHQQRRGCSSHCYTESCQLSRAQCEMVHLHASSCIHAAEAQSKRRTSANAAKRAAQHGHYLGRALCSAAGCRSMVVHPSEKLTMCLRVSACEIQQWVGASELPKTHWSVDGGTAGPFSPAPGRARPADSSDECRFWDLLNA